MNGEAPASASRDSDVEGAAPVPALPPGVLRVRLGPGGNCSSAGSAIDVLFYGSVLVGALAVALAAALPPKERREEPESGDDDGSAEEPR